MGVYLNSLELIPPPAAIRYHHQERQIKATSYLMKKVCICPNGSKYFRLKYRFGGKEKVLALRSRYQLKTGQRKTGRGRKQLADSIDPGENRKEVKSSKAEGAAAAAQGQKYLPAKRKSKSTTHHRHGKG